MSNEQKVGDEIPADSELIELHVSELRLLFNPIDPSPPRERDLDAKAEEFIVSWARSLARDAHLALRVDADDREVPALADAVGDATREFFRQHSLRSSRRLSQLFRVGRTSLLIGVVFLALAVILAGLVSRAFGENAFAGLIKESLVIGGWVAMWRPLQIFLYDWWPILAERKLYDRLSVMPVCVNFRAHGEAGHTLL
jgi:hypothetical protein